MPLLQIVRPPGEKVSPGESHQIEDAQEVSIRVYHYVDEEWRLDPKHALPVSIEIEQSDRFPSAQPAYTHKEGVLMKDIALAPSSGCNPLSDPELRDLPFALIDRTMELCYLSYVDPRDMIHDPVGRNILRTVENSYPVLIRESTQDDGRCYIWKFRSERTVYITVLGSPSASSIVADLVAVRISKAELGRVNESFAITCQWMEPFASHILCELKDDFDSIVCTGHSTGGACATLLSLILSQRFADKRVACTTFGSPRVGDRSFTRLFGDHVRGPSVRIMTHGDPVTALPMGRDYQHVNCAVALQPQGRAELWEDGADSGNRDFNWQEILYLIRFSPLHAVSEYADRIRDLLALTRPSAG